jgi:hypothetical protein
MRRWFLTSLSRNASSKARNDCSLEWENLACVFETRLPPLTTPVANSMPAFGEADAELRTLTAGLLRSDNAGAAQRLQTTRARNSDAPI